MGICFEVRSTMLEEAINIYNNYKVKPLPPDVVKKMRDIVNEAEEHCGVVLSKE